MLAIAVNDEKLQTFAQRLVREPIRSAFEHPAVVLSANVEAARDSHEGPRRMRKAFVRMWGWRIA